MNFCYLCGHTGRLRRIRDGYECLHSGPCLLRRAKKAGGEVGRCTDPKCEGNCELIDLADQRGAAPVNRWAVHCRSCHRVLSGFADPAAAIAAHNAIASAVADRDRLADENERLKAIVARMREALTRPLHTGDRIPVPGDTLWGANWEAPIVVRQCRSGWLALEYPDGEIEEWSEGCFQREPLDYSTRVDGGSLVYVHPAAAPEREVADGD